MQSNTNGIAAKVGAWLSIGVAIAVIIGTVAAVSNVAFDTRANLLSISEINRRIESLTQEIRQLQIKVASLDVSFNEVETQFCAEDTVRNLMHANDLRNTAMLWEKTFPGSHMPTDNVLYPNICNRHR